MIYDCFIFYDELMLLGIRLRELNPYVDKFVLVEATHTFSGEPKRLYYDEVKDTKVFAPFKDKIIHHIYDVAPFSNRWQNEHSQRDAIGKCLTDAKPDDIIIVSDADEIMNSHIFPQLKTLQVPGRLSFKVFYYFFNCLSTEPSYRPAFCRYRDYSSAQFLSSGTSMTVAASDNDYHKIVIPDAGWHFSYLMSADRIAKKIEVLCEVFLDTPYFRNKERIQRCIDFATDLYERRYKYSIMPLDAPQYVMNNIEKYKDFIKV